MTISDLRREYALAALDVADVDPDPIVQFRRWFDDATAAQILEPNAMTLATSASDGRPSARLVLLKEIGEAGLVFYTDYRSRKALELDQNPYAAVVFFWKEIERQVRLEGGVTRVATHESEAYFRTRPRGARIGAWSSRQSAIIPGREWLDNAVREAAARFQADEVPLPPHWGGYRLTPDVIEFWQGRPNRLHDRVRYRREEDAWVIERLSP